MSAMISAQQVIAFLIFKRNLFLAKIVTQLVAVLVFVLILII